MSYTKKILLVGDSVKVREFERVLSKSGVLILTVPNAKRALDVARKEKPDGIVFIVPTYWESVEEFIKELRQDKELAHTPIIYLGDLIEASEQLVLKRQGVHTMTLGPVPTEEVARFILHTIAKRRPFL